MHSHRSAGLRSRLTGNDAITVLELIELCLSCSKEDDFRALFPKIQELFPFDCVNTVLGTPAGKHGGVSPVYVLNVNFPREWFDEYMSKNYFQEDSVVQENFKSYAAQTWSIGRKKRYRKKEITSLGLDFGLRECCTRGVAPMPGGRHGSMFCFAGQSIQCTLRDDAILEILAPHLHMALSALHRTTLRKDTLLVLSPREKEVLEWVKQGKSSWEVSSILKISERTVNFHVGNILRKLDVVNRAQAVAVATRFGLIDVD